MLDEKATDGSRSSRIATVICIAVLATAAAWYFGSDGTATLRKQQEKADADIAADPTSAARGDEVAASPTAENTLAPNLSGIVQAATGKRVPDARIEIHQNDSLAATARTDAQGHFSMRAPSGTAMLKTIAAGYGAITVQVAAPSRDVVVTLFPGYTVAGQVLHAISRAPAANVRVIASEVPDRLLPMSDASVRTDAQGRFAFASLPGGRIFVSVNDAGLLSTETLALALGPQIRNDAVTLLVRPGAKVAGKFVIGTEDASCPAGQLQLMSEENMQSSSGSMKPPSTPVADGGEVRFAAVPYGRYRVAALCDEHQYLSGPLQLDLSSGNAVDLVWRFESGLGIEVAVTDEAGTAVPQALLSLLPAATGRIRSAQADKQGVYRFGALTAGAYELSARSPGMNGGLQAKTTVQLRAGLPQERVELVLPGIGQIRVHAHTTDGAPISRLLFHASDAKGVRFEAMYRGDGYYELGPLPRGDYRLFAYDNKNPKIPVRAAGGEWITVSGAQPVQIDFPYELPQASIEGRVLDANGRELANVLLRAVSSTLDSNDEFFSVVQRIVQGEQGQMTDAAGRFRIENLDPAATYRLFLQAPNGQKLMRAGIAAGDYVEVTLPALATLSGTVVDDAGHPVDAFMVVLEDLDSGERTVRNFTAAAGRFAIRDLAPGNLRLAVSQQGTLQTGISTVALQPGTSSQLRVVLRPGAPIKPRPPVR